MTCATSYMTYYDCAASNSNIIIYDFIINATFKKRLRAAEKRTASRMRSNLFFSLDFHSFH